MTLAEWTEIAALMENAFKGEMDYERAAAYFTFLAGYEAVDVERALHRIVRSGVPFLPTVPEIVAAIDTAARPTTPPATVMHDELGRAMRRYGRDRRDEAIRHLTDVHPLLAAFAAKEGWGRLCSLPLLDPQYGELELKRLGQRWVDWTEHAQHMDRDQLAAAAVERGRLTGPRRLDPVDQLGAARSA